MKTISINIILIMIAMILNSCQPKQEAQKPARVEDVPLSDITKKINKYVRVRLSTDMSLLTDKEKQMLPLLFEAAKIMDDLFWEQSYGQKEELFKYLDFLKDEELKTYVNINYGPWDRLENNEPFIDLCGMKPPGANFYPRNMTKKEFLEMPDTAMARSMYT